MTPRTVDAYLDVNKHRVDCVTCFRVVYTQSLRPSIHPLIRTGRSRRHVPRAKCELNEKRLCVIRT